MKIEKISIENFCGIKKLESAIGNETVVSGKNRSGKSTIKRAIYWIFNIRDENGKEITDIRPHDRSGEDMMELETSVSVTMDNGMELKKSYKANITKKGDFRGNSTDYFIQGISKTATEYGEYVKSIIKSDECLNAQAFFKQDVNGRRKMLESAFSQMSTEEMIDNYPEYDSLREMMKIGTVAELKKKWNYELKGDKTHKGLENLLDEIPTRIDEVEKQKIEIDFSELELAKNDLQRKIAECDSKIADAGKVFDDLRERDMKIQFELSAIMQTMNEELRKERILAEKHLNDAEYEIERAKQSIEAKKKLLTANNEEISSYDLKKVEINNRWKENTEKVFDESKWVFDDASTVCSLCGQTLPEDKIAELHSEFEEKKQKARDQFLQEKEKVQKDLTEQANKIKSRIKHLQEENTTLEKETEELVCFVNSSDEAENCRKKFESFPAEADYKQNPEYVKLAKEKEEINRSFERLSGEGSKEVILIEEENKREYTAELDSINAKLAKAELNASIDERIEELHNEQKRLAQDVADVTARLDLLRSFDRKKHEIFEEKINENFKHVKIKMFDEQVNGEIKDVCQITVDGSNYDTTLNHGDKILAEIDVCSAFQNAYGVDCPVIIDDCESVDENRIPFIEKQLITMRRTDGASLKIETK